MKKISVLVVDDSAMVRKLLTDIINHEPDMEVISTAPDPYIARDKLVTLKPDVMTLDIEMPRMDGLTFLNKVMHYFPVPTIVVSSVTPKGSATSLKALELGAVTVIPKPSVSYSIESIEPILIDSIRAAAQSKIKKPEIKKIEPENKIAITTTDKILAIGASTGGTEAIKEVLMRLPDNIPGTVVVQHMPPIFTKSYAERLNSLCPMEVKEAEEGDRVYPGRVLIAPGDFHMLLRRTGYQYTVILRKGPHVWHQRPAVDVLFKSVAQYAGHNAIGVILTGMGRDGASGLKMMHDQGAVTIGQDEKSSVVYGMPKEAFQLGAVDYVESLERIAGKITTILNNK